jgi:hypothetical protein
LCRQRLDLACHDREAASGFTRARRLDGRIQCQQIGSSGDIADQAGDRADLLHRCGQGIDDPARLFAGARGIGDLCRCHGDLAGDFLGRGGEVLACGGHDLATA